MRIRLAAAAAVVFGLPTAAALAEHDPYSGAPLPPSKNHETPSPITDRFYIEGIYYRPVVKTPLRVDPQGTPAGVVGTDISAERDLGLDSRLNMGRMEMMFRLRQRNKIRVDFLEVNRDATQQLGRTINFGNEIFLANSLLSSSLDYRMFGLTYTYSFFRNDRFEAGTGLGVDLIQAEAMAQVNSTQQRQDVSGAGPFPTIPLDLAFRISRRWSVTARGQYFHASLSNFNGYLAQVHEDVQYRWKDNFSLGIGYTSIRAKLALNTGNFPGLFAMSLEGPEAYFRVSF
ncbi:MAG TPA: hypothetical protein VHB68_00520 [Steroidobacteraceae bacterium]|nr:hypothetical protein [Steroidobacteraceae bacterium]